MKAGVGKRPNLFAGEDLPADSRQQQSLEKRARLKTAGLELFAEKGFERASVEEIAGRAKLAAGGSISISGPSGSFC
ncbi:MAG TPA: TetR family transcriptional regulator [Bryobacteraceae bacterium]|nr:TetR family transcriptional regulator [Bryobacteraceae bacterium]